MPATNGLSLNQRNLYLYFLHHRKKYGKQPCFVPRLPLQSSRMPDYIQAVERLAEKGYIRLDKRSWHYTSWIMLDPAPDPASDSAPACVCADDPV